MFLKLFWAIDLFYSLALPHSALAIPVSLGTNSWRFPLPHYPILPFSQRPALWHLLSIFTGALGKEGINNFLL